jgi:hypothetical protein
LKNKGKAGGIVDKRFGEENPNLTPEEKMLERFTKEKQVCAPFVIGYIDIYSVLNYHTFVTETNSLYFSVQLG